MTAVLAARGLVLDALGSRPQLHELEVEPPGAGEVRLRMRAAGVCHTDLTQVRDARFTPILLGHEGVAEVESVGEGVDGLAAGDRVLLCMADWLRGSIRQDDVVARYGGEEFAVILGIDLRQAELQGPEATITIYSVMGGANVIVPEGVHVELGGLAIMGGKDHRPGKEPVPPGAPVVRVRAYTLMGGVSVITKT